MNVYVNGWIQYRKSLWEAIKTKKKKKLSHCKRVCICAVHSCSCSHDLCQVGSVYSNNCVCRAAQQLNPNSSVSASNTFEFHSLEKRKSWVYVRWHRSFLPLFLLFPPFSSHLSDGTELFQHKPQEEREEEEGGGWNQSRSLGDGGDLWSVCAPGGGGAVGGEQQREGKEGTKLWQRLKNWDKSLWEREKSCRVYCQSRRTVNEED